MHTLLPLATPRGPAGPRTGRGPAGGALLVARRAATRLAAALAAAAAPLGAQAPAAAGTAGAAPAAPAAPAARAADADERFVDSVVTAAMRERRLAGVSVALVRGGRLTLAKGYGAAALDPRVPVDTATRFSVGSVTKQFVAALALLLQEEGRLSLGDPLARWEPGLTRAGEVTLLDLVHHVAGYRDYYPLDFVDRAMARPTTAERVVRDYGTRPLDFDPGTRWSYSNTGYLILGRVLERAGGRPLGALLEARVFRPLGMGRTAYEPAPAPGDARGYVSWALGDPEPAPPEGAGWLGAAGGIWSTAADLARWDLALLRPGFLSPASRAVLFGERTLRGGAPSGYAGGWFVARDGGRVRYSHGGATSGFSAFNAIVPDDTAAVVLLANADRNAPAGPLLGLVAPPRPAPPAATSAAAPAAAPAPAPPPAPRGPPALDAAADFFARLQRGAVDRAGLGAEYAAFLTPARAAAARRRLAPLGAPTRRELLGVAERGGMEVTSVRLTFGARAVTALMYRSPGGLVEQFLLW
jgi:CubicO group peptidase (beta-lactamase class C family)